MLAVSLAARSACAADVERIAIVYQASAACAEEADFLASVQNYTKRWERVPEGTAARTIRIRVVADTAGATGALVVERAGGPVSEREIAGPDCATVTEALAIMVAVAIDPHAGAAPASPGGAEKDTASVHPMPPAVRESQSELSKQATVSSFGARVSIDVRGEVTSAVVDGALFAVALSTKLELTEASGPSWLRALRPSLAIGVRQSLPEGRSLRGGTVEFLWSAGHLRLCPLGIGVGTLVELSVCGEGNVGRLAAVASGYANARSASRLWADVGGSAWVTVNVSHRFFLNATTLVTAPLTRQEFVLASGASVRGAPAVGVLGGLGLGVRL